ncbi:MAG: sulfatase-like hydrolase/transferase [Planctomycetaceae bacterium]|nr:sulfatase-like hydrolase/transferase [Planctomycetaceae bacterium]
MPQRCRWSRVCHFPTGFDKSRLLRCLVLFVTIWGIDQTYWKNSAAAQDVGRRPNIVFVFSDDHALQAIGAYGSKINQTPHLDRLASQGLVFDRSYCANSICGPSRACILTGLHSHLNGFRRNGDRFDGSQWVFPRVLQEHGYQTALIGKWHLESNPTGFDYWQVLPDQGHYYNPDFIMMDGTKQRVPGYCTDLITDASLKWLDQRDPSKPFLLMCQHKAPHRNWSPHPRHFGKYKLGTVPAPETLRDDYSGRSKTLAESEMTLRKHFYWGHDAKFHGPNEFPDHFRDGIPNGEYQRMSPEQRDEWDAYYQPENEAFLQRLRAGELSEDDVLTWKHQRYMHDYLGSVQAVDDSVGRVLDYLDANNLMENTIVVYSSDQGFYLGEHGWYDKRWMFEESLRMPLIVRWPGRIPAGSRSNAMVQNIDYAPTFLQAAGIEVPAQVQGRSLLPVFEAQGAVPAGWRDAIYYAYYENDSVHEVAVHDGVRTDRYKLMFFQRTNEWNLFDLEHDPQEMNSVHDDPQYQAILKGLQQRYRDLRKFYQVNSAVIPVTRGDEAWWKQRDREKTAQGKQQAHELVFIGDSITQGWEGAGKAMWDKYFAHAPALNLGFSGDRTEHVLWRLKRGQMGISKPRAAVIMIGTNNTGHRMQAPEETAAGVREIITNVRQHSPDTKIVLLGVFPRGETPFDPMRLNNVAINQYLSTFADDETVFYRDLSGIFLQEDGTLSRDIMPDLLHLNEAGYQRWAEALVPILQELEVYPNAPTP